MTTYKYFTQIKMTCLLNNACCSFYVKSLIFEIRSLIELYKYVKSKPGLVFLYQQPMIWKWSCLSTDQLINTACIITRRSHLTWAPILGGEAPTDPFDSLVLAMVVCSLSLSVISAFFWRTISSQHHKLQELDVGNPNFLRSCKLPVYFHFTSK